MRNLHINQRFRIPTIIIQFIMLILILIINNISISAQQLIQNGKVIYLSNTLIVKVKTGTTSAQLNETLSKFSINNTTEIYPSKDILNKSAGTDILAGIYLVNYNTRENPAEVAAKVAKMPGVLWAEPKFIREVCYLPDDSLYLIGSQNNLLQIGATQAWDTTTGNKKIIIGIVDTGVDWEHPDLKANIYMENDSLIPGSDLGGLKGRPDNDPSEDINPAGIYHGTFIAGLASAVTNNEIGIASVGFNCSILPVKVTRDDFRDKNGAPLIFYGYEGIKWAADHGAKVINCSWGGYNYSSYEQSIIDYALAKGAVVVAAQGNDTLNTDFFPANYDGVLSVGWLDTGIGVKTVNSAANYGEKVKVFAPGSNIYSTWQRPTQSSPAIYRAGSGSSASSPHVSGLAALVWSKFPFYDPIQVVERIRVTSDYIDDNNGSSHKHLLGHGVINAFRAVDGSIKATSVRADSIRFIEDGNGNDIFEPGEEVSIKMNFTNYLATVDNVTITLTTTDRYAAIENGTFNTGPMDTLSILSNESNEFRFKISEDVPYNHTINFLLTYSNGTNYTDFQSIHIDANVVEGLLYSTENNGLIELTVTSRGSLAFNDYPANLEGNGFRYKGSENLMFEGAFMFGIDPLKVMDGARIKDQQANDFVHIKMIDDGKNIYSFFSDSGAGSNALGIQTLLETILPGGNNFVILKSELINSSSQNIDSLYAGYYIDWDIPESGYNQDTTYFDYTNKFAVAYNVKDSTIPFTGMALISDIENFGYYAIDNEATSGNVVLNDENGFSDAEKWDALSNGVINSPGRSGNISFVLSGGPYNIPAGKHLFVTFSIAAAPTLQEVIDAIKQSRVKYGREIGYGQEPLVFQLNQNYPNPFNSSTVISYRLAADCMVTLKVYDILGRNVATLVNEFQSAGDHQVQLSTYNHQLSSGVYFYRMDTGEYSKARKLILLK